MNEKRIVSSLFVSELADRFQKRQTLDVADRSADLDDQNVGPFFSATARTAILISSVICGMT